MSKVPKRRGKLKNFGKSHFLFNSTRYIGPILNIDIVRIDNSLNFSEKFRGQKFIEIHHVEEISKRLTKSHFLLKSN